MSYTQGHLRVAFMNNLFLLILSNMIYWTL
ncbi:hypothetical protein UTI89UKE3_014 [Escherichia phage vB_EcoP-UTI89UKE3]|uniref:Uncharacterized protein n=1 Tax=Escherichia phage vB_EcoP-UTI89UKE2 TaxID=2865826 RepID=A0AAE7XUP5_9CAUD|nr:hypothetical protein UTI89UKE2_014 [Escherichia phage vB_EcoP-UTI89UKE2]QZI84615.1 hypothetical protein UTI89UKE3_014 [Escherichia phage vB_EcoP-UTI89UKE3]